MKHSPLYLLPGTLCTLAMFNEQITILKKQGFEVISVQFSLEKTIDEMVQTTIEAMENKPGNICGFSMGGIVALALADKRPDLISKLCLISSNCLADLPQRQAPREQHIKHAKQFGLRSVFQENYLPNYLFQHNDKHNTLITQMAESVGLEGFEAQLQALSTRKDTLSVLKNITCPVSIIAGENDKLCPKSHQLHMHEHCKTSDLTLLSNCGHFPMLERSNTVSTLLGDWLLR
jgi:pimeloyl-ACP methyl ester carboxylesterase